MAGCLLNIRKDGEVHIQPVTFAGETAMGDEVYGLSFDQKWRVIGTVTQGVRRDDGSMDEKRWVAAGHGGRGGRHEAGSKKSAVNSLLDALDLYEVDENETIPPLFG